VNAWQAVVYGVVQGLTEFLPISSSGHLRILPSLAGWPDPGASFTAVVQVGTLIAVVGYFARDLWQISRDTVASLWQPQLRGAATVRLGWFLLLGTIPIVIIGITLRREIAGPFRNLWVTATMLIVVGVLLYAADRWRPQQQTMADLTPPRVVLLGFAQAAALIPGVSRSGATIAAGRAMGMTRESAARFSFLLSVPAIAGSAAFEARSIGIGPSPQWPIVALATLAAFISGYAAIAWLLRWLSRHGMLIFLLYRCALGGLLIVLLVTGRVAAQ